MSEGRQPHPLPLVLAVVVVVAHGVWAAAEGRPIWLDEAITGTIARDGPWSRIATDDLHPPLLALLLGPLLTVLPSDLMLRLPSVVATGVTVLAVGRTAEALQGPRAGWLAALLAAASPPLAAYATEARPYALGTALVAAQLAGVATRRPALAAAAGAGAVATLYGTWFPVAVVASWGVLRLRGGARRFAVAIVPALTAAVLLATLVPAQLDGAGAGLAEGPLATSLGATGALPFVAEALLPGLGWLVVGRGGTAAAVLGALVVVGIGFGVVRDRSPLAAMATVPLLYAVVAGAAGIHPFGPSRHVLPLVPVFAVWAGTALDRRATTPVAAVVVGLLLGALPFAVRPPHHDVPAVLADLPEGVAVLADGSAAAAAWYGDVPVLPWRTGVAFAGVLDREAPAEPFWIVTTDARPEAVDEIRSWAADHDRHVDGEVLAHGARALLLSTR